MRHEAIIKLYTNVHNQVGNKAFDVEGNSIVIRVWDDSEGIEYDTVFDITAGGYDFEETSFVEIAPLEFEIDNEPQNELSSISINEIDFPKTVYMIVDNKIELETKYLRDYPDWQFLSEKDLDRKTIEIHFDMKIAKRSCTKEQKLIKVPNSNVFKIAAPTLISKGISRIVSPNNLISL